MVLFDIFSNSSQDCHFMTWPNELVSVQVSG